MYVICESYIGTKCTHAHIIVTCDIMTNIHTIIHDIIIYFIFDSFIYM